MSCKLKTYTTKVLISICFLTLCLTSCSFSDTVQKSRLTDDEKKHAAENLLLYEERLDYDSDEQFANFRALKGGTLKDNYIFRGASPYLNNERTPFVNNFFDKWNVKHVISLSESKEQIDAYVKNDTVKDMYFPKKYINNEIIDEPLNYEAIDLNNSNDVKKIIKSFQSIIKSEGNIYIHCAIGRDRTGVYCELLEALADSSYAEIVNDYMKSFENYSYLTYDLNPTKWEQIKSSGVDATLHVLTKTKNDTKLSKIDLNKATIDFLLLNGMSYEDIHSLIEKITK